MNGFPRHAFLRAAASLGLLVGCHVFQITACGAEKVEKEEPLHRPGKYSFRASGCVFYSDIEIKRDQPIFRELSDLRDQVYKDLRLPPNNDTLVHVYLFGDKDAYRRFLQLRYPGLPDRRAFFIKEEGRGLGKGELLVITYWSDRIQLDLRHELTHALLHSVLKDVPLWLDEGLAEYYALPPTSNGVSRTYVQALRNGDIHPDLARLEKIRDVKDMNTDCYREAWVWVYLMLRGKNAKAKGVLLAYLQELRTKPDPGFLRPRLADAVPELDDTLAQLLTQLADDHPGDKTMKAQERPK